MWVLSPGPGIKPASPTLAGGFLITGPPGNSHKFVFEVCESFFFYFILIGVYLQYCGVFLPYIDVNQPRVYMCPVSLTYLLDK